MNIVNRLRDKKTILFISHQLEILKNCNRLFELKDKNFLKIK